MKLIYFARKPDVSLPQCPAPIWDGKRFRTAVAVLFGCLWLVACETTTHLPNRPNTAPVSASARLTRQGIEQTQQSIRSTQSSIRASRAAAVQGAGSLSQADANLSRLLAQPVTVPVQLSPMSAPRPPPKPVR